MNENSTVRVGHFVLKPGGRFSTSETKHDPAQQRVPFATQSKEKEFDLSK